MRHDLAKQLLVWLLQLCFGVGRVWGNSLYL
jgi:hypothetical protein